MAPVRTIKNILMELRKVCQHPYLSAPELENDDAPEAEQHRQLVEGCGKLSFLKLLLPKLKQRGHRVLLFSQFKIALDRIEDFLYGEGYKFLRLDGDVQQAQRQKSMDAFNAPDSEYFIFLLTTRAGGVGINLATADTVIVYDPDFNPHMDQQAIARSHRYGQTKKVLVFKLMTKNSVEEQIILNGKKKMVLDHLVVQQMGKENEEGDVDNMLLHGAAALYDTNEDGFSASDIRYTSKDVDLLIDKVEADADADAKAMEEREKQKANGEDQQNGAGESGEVALKPKESMSFAFAKIWEADGNRLEEVGDVEESPEDDANTWRIVMENVEKARQAAIQAEQGQRAVKRQAAVISAQQNSAHAQTGGDDTTPLKKKGKRRQNAAQLSADAEFAINSDEIESGSDAEVGSVDLHELVNVMGRSDVGGTAANIDNITQEQADQLRKLKAASEVLGKASAEGSNGSSLAAAPESTPGPLSASTGKESKSEESRVPNAARQVAANNLSTTTTSYAGGSNALGSLPRNAAMAATSIKDPVAYGRQVMLTLYTAINTLGIPQYTRDWARVALDEVNPRTRVQLYLKVAQHADYQSSRLGHQQFFTLPEVVYAMTTLIYTGKSLIPGITASDLQNLNSRIGREQQRSSLVQQQHASHPQMSHSSRPAQPVQIPQIVQQEQATHQHSPYMSNSSRTAQVEGSSSRPPTFPAQPARIAQPVAIPVAAPVSAPIAQPEPKTSAIDKTRQVSNGNGLLPPPVKCAWCHSEEHTLPQCGSKPDVAHLKSIRRAMIEGNEDEETKRKGLEQVDHLLALLDPSHPNSPAVLSASTPKAPVTSATSATSSAAAQKRSTPALGTRDFAIVVDDDDDDGGADRLLKRPKLLHDKAVPTPTAPSGRGPSNTFTGCVVCGAEVPHPAVSCPRVTAGPESIQAAMNQFSPDHPVRNVLQILLLRALSQSVTQRQPSTSVATRAAAIALVPPNWAPTTTATTTACAFCGKACGRRIRDCATALFGEGGRKVLKSRIRNLEDEKARLPTGVSRSTAVAEELFKAYLEWPRASAGGG